MYVYIYTYVYTHMYVHIYCLNDLWRRTPGPEYSTEACLRPQKTGTKRIGSMELTIAEYDYYRGKLRRICEPKRDSGRIEVPMDIHEKFMSKGRDREEMLETFITCGGVKAAGFSRRCVVFCPRQISSAWGLPGRLPPHSSAVKSHGEEPGTSGRGRLLFR